MKSTQTKSTAVYYLILLKLFLFLIFVFQINKVAFIFYFSDRFSNDSATEIISVFLNGYLLDLAMACYLILIPFIFLILQQFITIHFYKAFIFLYGILLLIVTSFISVFDMGIYHDWNEHLNYRAINYLHFVKEAAAFSDKHSDNILTVIMISQLLAGIILLFLLFRYSVFRINWKGKKIAGLLTNLVIAGLIVIGIRGGLPQIPVNESSAYFSLKKELNDAALNVQWNAAKKFFDNKNSATNNPFDFYNSKEAAARVKNIHSAKIDSTISILTTTKPNIVLFVLESFTADVFEQLGGEAGVTPNLDTVINNGLLFTNIYAPGYRTDQGLASVYSGFPATPNFSVAMQPEKYHGLHFLPRELINAGYSTSFYYGGELDFANMKAFFLASGISDLHDKSSYSKNKMNAKWGAHDQFVFEKQAKEMSGKKEPFFSSILSLSSHEPFEVPMKAEFPGDDIPSKFKSCCYYTDKSIGEYLQRVSKEPWYKNTLFIFVADHGHIYPRNRKTDEPARFHIPLIFYGDVLKPEMRGTKINNIGMQSDIAATLLSQLHLPIDEFQWSNNLLNANRNNFAYYSFDSGIGWITQSEATKIFFEDEKTKPAENKSAVDAKCYLQKLYGEYVGL